MGLYQHRQRKAGITHPDLSSTVACAGARDVGRMSHQDIEENLLKVSCVLIGQPACVLFLTFSPRSHNLDLNLAWQEQYG